MSLSLRGYSRHRVDIRGRRSVTYVTPCKYCWAEFESPRADRAYCSKECGDKYRAHERRQEDEDIKFGVVRPGGYGDNPRMFAAWLNRRVAS